MRIDVRSNDVQLTWNLTGGLLKIFWDNPPALIYVSWSRWTLSPRDLILLPGAEVESNDVEMTQDFICSSFGVSWDNPYALFGEWWFRRSLLPEGLDLLLKDWCWGKTMSNWLEIWHRVFWKYLRPSTGSYWKIDVINAPVAERANFGTRRTRLLHFKPNNIGMAWSLM